tara:strand:+ start:150 stop:338 length:189 start_codon:yes stop_codon:yes gene_type:complete
MPITPRIKAAASKIMPAINIRRPSIQPPCPEIMTSESKTSRIGMIESTKEIIPVIDSLDLFT